MEENEIDNFQVRKFKHGSWTKMFEKKWLKWLGFSDLQINGEPDEKFKFKPLQMRAIAKKDSDGTLYIRIERSFDLPKTESTEPKPTEPS